MEIPLRQLGVIVLLGNCLKMLFEECHFPSIKVELALFGLSVFSEVTLAAPNISLEVVDQPMQLADLSARYRLGRYWKP